jgi:hypothetical protein
MELYNRLELKITSQQLLTVNLIHKEKRCHKPIRKLFFACKHRCLRPGNDYRKHHKQWCKILNKISTDFLAFSW